MAPRKFNSMPDWFLKTRFGRQVQEEAEDEILRSRQEIADELRRVLDEGGQEIEALQAQEDELQPRVIEAARRHKELRRELQRIRNEQASLALSREHRIDRLRARLRETADPIIQEFEDQLQAEFEALRKRRPDVTQFGEPNLKGQRRQVSNYPSITERLQGLTEARREISELAESPVDGEDLQERLREIYEAVPTLQPPEAFIPEDDDAPPPASETAEGAQARRYGARA
jgi:predicted RNase H-like nuclease (RuvC/YqgF family)